MKKETLITIITVAITIAVVMFGFEFYAGQKPAPSSLGEINRFTSGLTTTSVLCGTSSTLLLATSSARQYAAFVNDGSTNIYLELSQSPAVKYEGIRLNSGGGAYEINLDNLYTGPVYCIADTSAASSTVTYK